VTDFDDKFLFGVVDRRVVGSAARRAGASLWISVWTLWFADLLSASRHARSSKERRRFSARRVSTAVQIRPREQ
jgi:hypothetical protein